MKVLVACEFSGIVRDAFIERGHDAMSCDLLPSERPGPHYRGPVEDILYDGQWDLMVAHPPCTYLSKAGARWMHPAGGVSVERLALAKDARTLFLALLAAPIERVAVENPTPLKIVDLPEPTQAIQPYQFGHPYSKRTLLWLRGLPPLKPTSFVTEHRPYLPSNTGGRKRGQQWSRGVAKTAQESSRTFAGIAAAMAEQWGAA